jgi:hypothetical protein
VSRAGRLARTLALHLAALAPLVFCLADLACGRDCPPGQVFQVNPLSENGGGCAPPANPNNSPCYGLGCAQSVHLDAGLELACASVEGDDCSACAAASCCPESLACLGADGGVCSPSDPAGVALATCITDHCSEQCPGVP